MARTAAVLVESTALVRRSCRFVLVVFLVRMWRRYAAPRLMLPLPRTLKRFAAPFFVFILGMTALSFRMTPGDPAVTPLERRCEYLKPRLSLVEPAMQPQALLQPFSLPF